MRRRIDTYAVVLFDCDDTILATAKNRWSVMIATARTFSCAIDESDIRAVWGLPFGKMIRTLLPRLDHDEYVAAYRQAMRESPPDVTPGARELLQFLKLRRVQMRVVTSSSRDLIVQDLDVLGLRSYFAEIYGHEQTPFHKPDPRVLHRPIADIVAQGIDCKDVLYIGDSARDHRAAQGNGLNFIGVTSGIESAGELRTAGVPHDAIVASLGALLPSSLGESAVPVPRGGLDG